MSAPGVRTGLAERLSLRAIPALGSTAIDALMATVRWEIAGAEHYRGTWGAGRPTVFVLWHGHLLPGAYYHRGQGLATLISQHRDGEYIARVVQGWGFTVVRGSSTRGGKEALVEIVRVLRRGQAVAITPDGPTGPRGEFKPGPWCPSRPAPTAAGTSAAGIASWCPSRSHTSAWSTARRCCRPCLARRPRWRRSPTTWKPGCAS